MSLQAQLFSDDFTRGTDPGPLPPWTTNADGGDWTVTGGVLIGGPNTLPSYGDLYITNSWDDYSVQAQFQFPVGAFGGGLGGRLNPATGAHYGAWIYPENSSGGSSVLKLIKFQTWSSFAYTNSIYAPMAEVSLAAVGTNWHTVTMAFQGAQITVSYDTNQVLSVTDVEPEPYLSGAVSLDFYTDTNAYQMTVDNVVVLAPAASVTVNGAQTYQLIEGFGVNANHRGWTNNELQPVLDALIDQAGMTLFRVVYDNSDWETNNENSGPTLTNWNYFSTAYSTPEFQALWGIMGYLNQRGITNGLMPSFQGFGPSWMGGFSLTPGYENAWAEMIASALVYARYTNHLQFTLVGPNNEPDSVTGAGIGTSQGQYPATLDALSQQLDTNGMADVRFVGPDLAQTSTGWLSTMMNDSTVKAKLAHFGLHGYQGISLGSAGVSKFLEASAYTNITFWMTEFNVWCQSCQSGGQGTNNWDYFLGTADYLLANLANGASGGLVWEGYDSIYRNNNDDGLHWSFWGLFAVDKTNAVPKTYTPRKNFYTLSQITAFVRPGARRIEVSISGWPLTLLAFYNTNNGHLTLTGDNTNNSIWSLSGTLTSLPAIPSLDFYYTSSTTNLCYGGRVPVINGAFSVAVPADCVFTLTYTNHAPSLSPVSILPINAGQTVTINNHTSDPDAPPQTLSLALLTAPAGATLDTNTGIFTWRAPAAFANTTNIVTLAVTDNGYPPLGATQSFSLVVNPLSPPTLQTPTVSNGLLTLGLIGPIGPDYLLQRSTNLTTWSTILTAAPSLSPFNLIDTNTPLFPAAFYRIRLSP